MDHDRNNRKKQKDQKENVNKNDDKKKEFAALQLPDEEEMKGPTDYSNWIVKGSILVGAYPKNAEIVSNILKQGITTFICMMTDDEIKRQGKHYFDVVKGLVEKSPKEFPLTPLKSLQYIHLPIYDKSVTDDDKLVALLDDILARYQKGEKMYIHCRGGHGRTGVIVSCLLARMYALDAYNAMEVCTKYHDYRTDVKEKPGVYSTPETHEQKDQVYRVVARFNKE